MQKGVDKLCDDCQWQIILQLSPSDLLAVKNLCKRWNSVAQITWRAMKVLRVKEVEQNNLLDKIAARAGRHVKILSFEGCERINQSLDNIFGLFHNLDRMEFNFRKRLEDKRMLPIFANQRELPELIDATNVMEVIHCAAKLMLAEAKVIAINRFLDFNDEVIFNEYDIFELLKEMGHSERIFSRVYDNWNFFDEELSDQYDMMIKKGFEEKQN